MCWNFWKDPDIKAEVGAALFLPDFDLKCILYLIHFSGLPDNVADCKQLNHSTDSIHLKCLPGFDGGLTQVREMKDYFIHFCFSWIETICFCSYLPLNFVTWILQLLGQQMIQKKTICLLEIWPSQSHHFLFTIWDLGQDLRLQFIQGKSSIWM